MRNPNGYGSICKLKGKRRRPWCVRLPCKYELDGDKLKHIRPVLGYYRTRSEALQALAEYNKCPYDAGSGVTFAEIFELWLAEKDNISPKTAAVYRSTFKKCAALHDLPIEKIRLNQYQQVLNQYADQSTAAKNDIKVIMSSLSKYALKHELIPADRTAMLTFKATAPKLERKVFTMAEIDKLWAEPSGIERDITLILLYTGFRINELLTMTADNIDLNMWTYTGGSKTKAGKNRIVPIHSRIQPIAALYPDGFDMLYRTYNRYLKTLGHTPHDTRHTFISRMQSAGCDKICLERIVGHASEGITDNIYTHKDIDELRKNIELIE